MMNDKVRCRWLTRHSFASRKKDGAIHALKDNREKRGGRIKIPAYYGAVPLGNRDSGGANSSHNMMVKMRF
jgi:hypothetical protein